MAVAGCILVVLVFAVFHAAAASKACSSGRNGRRTEFEIQLGTSILDASEASFKVNIPEVCNGDTSGVKVTGCDYDVAPDVFVVSNKLAYIRRKGSKNLVGSVSANVYCYDRGLGSSLEGTDPSLTIKAISESHSARRNARSLDSLQTALDDARTQALLRAHRSDQAVQALNNRQEVANEVLANDARQAALVEARHQVEHEARNTAQAILSSNRRQLVEAVRESLADNARQVALDEARHQAEHNARRAALSQARRKTNEGRRTAQTVDARLVADVRRQTVSRENVLPL